MDMVQVIYKMLLEMDTVQLRHIANIAIGLLDGEREGKANA